MRGDQLSRQQRVVRALEVSPNGLTVAEIAKREETGIRTIYRDLETFLSKCHAEAQRAPREIYWILLPSLKVFSVPLLDSIENKVKKNSLQVFASWRLCMRRVFE